MKYVHSGKSGDSGRLIATVLIAWAARSRALRRAMCRLRGEASGESFVRVATLRESVRSGMVGPDESRCRKTRGFIDCGDSDYDLYLITALCNTDLFICLYYI